MRIILLDPFFNRFSSYVVFACNHCHWKNQNFRSMMDLTSHLSYISDTFYSYRVSFSLMTSLTIMGLDPGHLVRARFYSALIVTLVVLVALFMAFLLLLELNQLMKLFRCLC